MRKSLALIISLTIFCLTNAQTVEEIKKDKSIFWAEGIGATLKDADEMALAELSRQISVDVSAKTSYVSVTNDEGHSEKKTNEIFTNTNAVFNNIEMRIITDKPEFRVIRWISKAEIKKQEENRLAKLREMVRVGNVALQSKQISDAIRYYYWAYALLGTLPQQSTITVEDENYESQVASVWIPNRLKSIFGKLKCTVVGKSDDGVNDYEVVFLYDEQPLANVDFTYFDGADWSPVCTAVDGKGIVELRPSYTPDQLMVRYEYKFIGEAKSDKEVDKVLSFVSPSFDSLCASFTKLNALQKEVKQVAVQFDEIENKEANAAKSLQVSPQEIEACDQVMRQVVQAIRKKNYSSVASYFTPTGLDIYNRLIHYGAARIIGGEPTLTYTQFGDDIMCRSILMSFTFSGNRKFTEDVVFTFNRDGLIDNITFGLGKVAQDNLMGNIDSSFTPEKSQILANFLECFKTAYALKRLDYLEQVFDDDAIITGKVLSKYNGNCESGFQNNKYVQLTRQDKATYLKHLKRCFASKEFINIKFANNRIRHTKVEGVYAIQIKQDYFSSNYGDSGYLFLIIDVRNPKEPIIHVRAWQENPDPDWGLLGPEFF